VFGAQGKDRVYDVRGELQTVTAQAPPTDEKVVTTFFPGTLDSQGASVIRLEPAGDVRGIDFTAGLTHARHVRGVVINGDTGEPVREPLQLLITGDGTALKQPAAKNPFDLGLVVPGIYVIATTAGTLTGRSPVEVIDRDVDVTLSVTAGFSIPGQLTIVGGSESNRPPDPASLRVNLRLDPPTAPGPPAATPATNGAFQLQSIPTGNYRVAVTPLQNAVIESARLGGADVLDSGIHLERQPSGQLSIVLNMNPASLDGIVVDERQLPVAGVTVALVPEAPHRSRMDLYKNATTDASGRFHCRRLLPEPTKFLRGKMSKMEPGSMRSFFVHMRTAELWSGSAMERRKRSL
jgi:hypothetical protein